MLGITWKFVLILSLIVIVVVAGWSLLFEHEGTFNTMREDLIPEDRWYSGKSARENDKYESKGEEIARRCIENIYGQEFKNVRLPDIKNPNTGRNLEIDCYNADLKIGVEYHGIMHYQFCPYFHKTPEDFAKAKQRDQHKQDACKQLGIALIVVPYTTSHDKICDYIKRELKRYNKLDHLTGWNDEYSLYRTVLKNHKQ